MNEETGGQIRNENERIVEQTPELWTGTIGRIHTVHGLRNKWTGSK